MNFHFDHHLLGIIISSFVVCLCSIMTYFGLKETILQGCNENPVANFSDMNSANLMISNEILNAKRQIFISAYNVSYKAVNEIYLGPLKLALENGAKLSIIISESDLETELVLDLFRSNQINNVTLANVSVGFVVIDDKAFMFNELFSSYESRTSLITEFNNCDACVQDILSFFNYQWKRIQKKLPDIIPIKYHAKSSLISPFHLPSDEETFYFFHNPTLSGDPLRISTSDLITSTLYANAYSQTHKNVSLFSSVLPPYTGLSFSLYQIFSRILMATDDPGFSIKYLIPKSEKYSPWINSTAALSGSEIYLYDNSSTGPQFILIGNRVFVFSHPLNDVDIENNIGFHYSTNSSIIVQKVQNYFDECLKSSEIYHL